MNIGINDLDDDDFGMGFEPSSLTPPPGLEPRHLEHDDDDDFLSDFLKTRGIDDPSKIKFEGDDGGIEERDWNSLSKEEKINILNTPLETHEDNKSNELTLEEIDFINQIRQSNLTPNQFVEGIKNQQVLIEPQYKVDDLSDDELFLLDLESRVGDLSEEAEALALANAKQNEDLFKKQVEGIRREYKEREDYETQREEARVEQEKQEAYNQFLDTVIESINQFNSIGNLDLNFDDSDREELALFMLSRDEAGNNYLWLALLDPETLVKAAWFILNGEEALNGISDYFVKLIKLVSDNQYKKGFEEGKNGLTPSRPLVVISKNNKQINRPSYKTIEDLDDDD